MSKTSRLILLAAVAAVGVAGCGGGGRLSKADYEQKLKAAGTEIATAARQLSSARTQQQFQDGARSIQKAFDHAASDLDGRKPPRDVESANDRLVRAFHGMADEFGDVVKAAEQGPDAARKRGQEIGASAASRDANLAIKEIKRRGYDVGRLGS